MNEPSVLQIFVFRDGAYVGSEVFTEPEIVVGRDGADLMLDDDSVAQSHAIVQHEGGTASVMKLGSGSVRVNRQEVDHVQISPRDEIQIGAHTLKIKFIGQKRPSLSAAPAPAKPATRAAPVAARRAPLEDIESPAALANDLATEAMTEVVETSPPISPSWPVQQPVPRAPFSTAPTAKAQHPAQNQIGTAKIRERATLQPAGQAPRESAASHQIARAISQITGSIEISGSDVLAAHTLDPESLSPEPGAHQSFDGVWADESSDNSGGMAHGELDAALDAAFLATPDLPSPAPEPQRSLRSSSDYPSPIHAIDAAPAQAPAMAARPAPAPAKPAPVAPSTSAPVSPDFDANVEQTARRPNPQLAPSASSSNVEPQKSRSSPGNGTSPLARIKLDDARIPGTIELPSDTTPPPAVHHGDDDEDEEELDERVRPSFSLIRTLVQSTEPALGLSYEGVPSLEVIGFSGDAVRSAALLKERGDRYVLGKKTKGVAAPDAGHTGLKLAKLVGPDLAELEFPSSAEGVVIEPDRNVALDSFKVPENAVSKKGSTYRAKLRPGSTATITLGDSSFHLRFVRAPVIAKEKRGPIVQGNVLRAVGSSVAVHMLAGVMVGILSPGLSYSEGAREVWSEPAEEIREVEIKPEEPKPPEPEPEPVPEPVEQEAPPPEPEPEPKQRPKRSEQVGPRAKPGEQVKQVKSIGVLGAMGKLNLAAPGKKSVVAAVSNIDAVRAPGGSNFRVGALIGKLPASSISVGGGGGGGALTRGGAALLKGGEGLASLGKRSEGKVRGSVTRVTARQVEAKGSISREEVAAVINAHLREVQYCYEKTLLKEPGLTGKLVLEWTINTDGSVGRVKEKLSTLKNPAVSSCISSSLKRWTFPKPRGGIVIVSYPFIFNAVGF